MGDNFKLHGKYKCISTSGSSASFENVECTMERQSLFNYMDKEIFILDSTTHDKYVYKRDVVEVKRGSTYNVVNINPLILEGDVSFPVQEPSEEMRNASELLARFMSEHKLCSSRSIIHAVLKTMEWEINRTWNGGYNELIDILKVKLEQLISQYNGSWNGYGVYQEIMNFILCVFTPLDYDVAIALPEQVMPNNITVSIEEDKEPRIMVDNNTTLLDWYKKLISPISGVKL